MYVKEIDIWRNSPKITAIRGEKITSDSKLKLFEQGVDYLFTSKCTVKVLINQILGFSKTKCEVFKKLSIDNSLLFPSSITREIAYMIALSFLKYNSEGNINCVLNYLEVSKWISAILNHNITIPSAYINEIKLKNECYYFSKSPYNTLLGINLHKLIVKQISSGYKYTKKPFKLNIKELFHNHIYKDYGRCLGAVKYWLEEMALAYDLAKNQRCISKNNFVKSLEIDNNLLKNPMANQKIEMYKKGTFGYLNLIKFSDNYILVCNLPDNLVNIINNMKEYKLSQLYIQILTNSHAFGLVIIIKGDGLKFLLYDPNDPLLYAYIFIQSDDLNLQNYRKVCDYFKNLLTEPCYEALLVKTFIPLKSANNEISLVPTYPKLSNLGENQIKDLLLLGMINHDHKFIAQILKINKLNLDFNFGDNGLTPIILAVNYGDIEMVELLLKYGADINKLSDEGKSPLYLALELFNLKMIKLLLANKAEVNNNHDKFNPHSLIESVSSLI